MAPADRAALDAAALARRGDVLARIVDRHERVAPELRQLNWPGAMKSAFARIDETGHWTCISGSDESETRGIGFVALIGHLAAIDEHRAAAALRGLLAGMGAAAA